jgi:hypothetical protein
LTLSSLLCRLKSWGSYAISSRRKFPNAVLTRQSRVEDVFIPDNSNYPDTNTCEILTANEEIIIAEEYLHDLEIWRREIGEVERRRGVYLGRAGTFVKKEWELGVLPNRVVYARWSGVDPSFGPSYELVEQPFGRLDQRKIAVML